MAITNWPKEDRPREKLLTHGARMLTDAELLAIFINTGVQGKTALEIARELIMEYGSLKKFLDAEANELCRKKGLGKAKFATIKAAIEIGHRYALETLTLKELLPNSRAAQQFLLSRLSHHEKEVFACLFLTVNHRLLAFEELFFGTINEANIYPREVVKRGLKLNAAKIILAHNHPSGNVQPSQADIDVTRLLRRALALVDIEVIDHIIVANNDYFSFSYAGLL